MATVGLGTASMTFADSTIQTEQKSSDHRSKHLEKKEEKMSETITKVASYLNKSEEELKRMIEKDKTSSRALALSAILSKKSGESLEDMMTNVQELKGKKERKELVESYGISDEELKTEMFKVHPVSEVALKNVATYMGITEEEAKNLVTKQKVSIRQLALADIISKKSGQSLDQVFTKMEELKGQKERKKALLESYQLDANEIEEEMKKALPHAKRKKHGEKRGEKHK
ncbi:hypothetical protein IC620_00905 [Hazenella sp. IB182357]|uniref:Uncharacterized protein n=1 Tax=Polycladospora coralii TaxID=2771432 RepID=A0A926RSC1_9BACL|nr:hypothetical protein [Polycladospora coralii]MBD1370920.1 hypothetical protein [Polycladospora coralii]MBS7529859.1 hypothetical protein [Polycladospora coralii]